MATNTGTLQTVGRIHGHLATELGSQIDNIGNRSAAKLMALGVPPAIANEIITEATAKTGNAAKLNAMGVSEASVLATALNGAA